MGGIDYQDQINSYYPFSRNTVRWYKKIGIHIIQMLLLNSYNLYNQSQVGYKMSLYDFSISILSELTQNKDKILKENIFQKHTRLEKMDEHFVKDVVFALKAKFEKILHISVLLVQIVQVFA